MLPLVAFKATITAQAAQGGRGETSVSVDTMPHCGTMTPCVKTTAPKTVARTRRCYREDAPFWLTITSRQLAAIRRYIRGNPARALWKLAHPDRFRVLPGIRHASLDPAFRWSAMGDPTLLASPFRFPVRLTRRLPVEAQEEALVEAINRARLGMVPVCGFISPAEHELERRLRAEPSARWIKAVPHGLREGYDPSHEDSRALAEGRLLLLSSFAPEVPVSPISRANCEAMNSRILRLCGEAAAPVVTRVTGTSPAPPL